MPNNYSRTELRVAVNISVFICIIHQRYISLQPLSTLAQPHYCYMYMYIYLCVSMYVCIRICMYLGICTNF